MSEFRLSREQITTIGCFFNIISLITLKSSPNLLEMISSAVLIFIGCVIIFKSIENDIELSQQKAVEE